MQRGLPKIPKQLIFMINMKYPNEGEKKADDASISTALYTVIVQ